MSHHGNGDGRRVENSKKLSTMDSALGKCECINMILEPTTPTVESVDNVLPLVKTSKGLVQSIDLHLLESQ